MNARPQAVATVQFDNEHAKATEWRFAPGTETGWHRHGYNYAVVPMTDGTLLVESATGERQSLLAAGKAYGGVIGTEHNVVNVSDHEVVFVEVEMKKA